MTQPNWQYLSWLILLACSWRAFWPMLFQVSDKHQFSTLIFSDYWQFPLLGLFDNERKLSVVVRVNKVRTVQSICTYFISIVLSCNSWKGTLQYTKEFSLQGTKHFIVWSYPHQGFFLNDKNQNDFFLCLYCQVPV